MQHFNAFVQDCNNYGALAMELLQSLHKCNANALELLQSCAKPSIW